MPKECFGIISRQAIARQAVPGQGLRRDVTKVYKYLYHCQCLKIDLFVVSSSRLIILHHIKPSERRFKTSKGASFSVQCVAKAMEHLAKRCCRG